MKIKQVGDVIEKRNGRLYNKSSKRFLSQSQSGRYAHYYKTHSKNIPFLIANGMQKRLIDTTISNQRKKRPTYASSPTGLIKCRYDPKTAKWRFTKVAAAPVPVAREKVKTRIITKIPEELPEEPSILKTDEEVLKNFGFFAEKKLRRYMSYRLPSKSDPKDLSYIELKDILRGEDIKKFDSQMQLNGPKGWTQKRIDVVAEYLNISKGRAQDTYFNKHTRPEPRMQGGFNVRNNGRLVKR